MLILLPCIVAKTFYLYAQINQLPILIIIKYTGKSKSSLEIVIFVHFIEALESLNLSKGFFAPMGN